MRQGNGKWWAAAGLAALVIGYVGGQDEAGETSRNADKRAKPRQAPAVSAPITAASLERDGNYWIKQPADNQTQLVALCLPRAARDAKASYDEPRDVRAIRRLEPEQLVNELDKTYAEEFYRDDSIQEACNDKAPEVVREQRYAREEAKAKREAEAEAAARRRLRNFKATNELARLLVNVRLGEENVDGKRRVRSVNCINRTTCTIGYMEDPTGSLFEELFESNDEPEDAAQTERAFFDSMAKLFKTLFKDRRLQSATLVAHGGVISPGGKESTAPIMRMTCTRSAHRQINWDRIAYERPDGFKQLCRHELLVRL